MLLSEVFSCMRIELFNRLKLKKKGGPSPSMSSECVSLKKERKRRMEGLNHTFKTSPFTDSCFYEFCTVQHCIFCMVEYDLCNIFNTMINLLNNKYCAS